MELQIITVLLAAYLIGSIPFGYIILKLISGEDIRNIESGRTGGTNTMRAAGFGAGFLTVVLDVLTSAGSVVAAKQFSAFQDPWLLILVPLMVIVGNNYSIYLVKRDKNGKIQFGGGAGGAVCVGSAIGLWWPSGIIIVLVGILVFYFIGYASVLTMWIALGATLIFAYRAIFFDAPWAFAAFGLIAEGLLLISLRPNIKRLIEGTERLHGYRAKQIGNQTNYSS